MNDRDFALRDEGATDIFIPAVHGVRDAERLLAEERANAATHAMGLVLAVAVTPVLTSRAAAGPAPWAVTTFCAALILVYLASSLHHGARRARVKLAFLVCDHMAIFGLIAASYLPFAALGLPAAAGRSLVDLVLGLAGFGILVQIVSLGRRRRALRRWAVPAMYLLLGWGPVLLYLRPLTHGLPGPVFALLAAGGLVYSAGVVAFMRRSVPYSHAVWHLAVVAGSACHVAAVFLLTGPA